MSGVLTLPRTALILAGFAAATLGKFLKTGEAGEIERLKKSVADLDGRLANQEALNDNRFNQVEARLQEHERRLDEVPSTSQFVEAMEALLAKTMTSLDERLSAQARSIEVLKTTVSQTDELLERVLESIDSLRQSNPEDETALVP